MIETQLTEFVGLTSHYAEKQFDKKVPQGVLEKMLAISTRRLGATIEGVDRIYHRRGEQFKQRIRRVAIEYTVSLENLRSKYFERSENGEGKIFRCTAFFDQRFSDLSKKTYFPEYETWIKQLVNIWMSDSGFQNLLYLSLVSTGEGGTIHLSADLELIIKDIEDYLWVNVLQRDIGKRDPKKFLERVKNTRAALEEKLEILTNHEIFEERLKFLKTSVVGQRILSNCDPYPSQSEIWPIFRFLASKLVNIAETLTKWPPTEAPLFGLERDEARKNVDYSMVKHVTDLLSVTNNHFPPTRSDAVENIEIAFEALSTQVDLWCRALSGFPDAKFHKEHGPKNTIHHVKKIIVYYDIRKSTEALLRVERDPDLWTEYELWFDKLISIAKNWSILFGAKVSSIDEEAGDKVKVFFEKPIMGLWSLGMVLSYIRMVNSNESKDKTFQFSMNGGIGESQVLVREGKEHSPAISYLAKTINDLSDSKQPGTNALAKKEFIEEHPEFQRFCLGKLETINGREAHFLDYLSVAGDFCKTSGLK